MERVGDRVGVAFAKTEVVDKDKKKFVNRITKKRKTRRER